MRSRDHVRPPTCRCQTPFSDEKPSSCPTARALFRRQRGQNSFLSLVTTYTLGYTCLQLVTTAHSSENQGNPMHKSILVIALVAALAGCEKSTVVQPPPPPSSSSTTVVTPPPSPKATDDAKAAA